MLLAGNSRFWVQPCAGGPVFPVLHFVNAGGLKTVKKQEMAAD